MGCFQSICGFIFTPRVSNASGVIVLARSVCLCVCVFVSLSQTNGQTYGPEFQHVGQVDDYLGQVCRSRS